jgi:hypothetical protein
LVRRSKLPSKAPWFASSPVDRSLPVNPSTQGRVSEFLRLTAELCSQEINPGFSSAPVEVVLPRTVVPTSAPNEQVIICAEAQTLNHARFEGASSRVPTFYVYPLGLVQVYLVFRVRQGKNKSTKVVQKAVEDQQLRQELKVDVKMSQQIHIFSTRCQVSTLIEGASLLS